MSLKEITKYIELLGVAPWKLKHIKEIYKPKYGYNLNRYKKKLRRNKWRFKSSPFIMFSQKKGSHTKFITWKWQDRAAFIQKNIIKEKNKGNIENFENIIYSNIAFTLSEINQSW